MSRVTKKQEEKSLMESRMIKDLKYLIKMNAVNRGISKRFPNAKRILAVARSDVGIRKIWTLTHKDCFRIVSPFNVL